MLNHFNWYKVAKNIEAANFGPISQALIDTYGTTKYPNYSFFLLPNGMMVSGRGPHDQTLGNALGEEYMMKNFGRDWMSETLMNPLLAQENIIRGRNEGTQLTFMTFQPPTDAQVRVLTSLGKNPNVTNTYSTVYLNGERIDDFGGIRTPEVVRETREFYESQQSQPQPQPQTQQSQQLQPQTQMV
jgi:hypothetical protein